jgi:hypothetical protein
MKKLIDTFSNPSGWDSLSNYMGEIPPDGVYVVMGRNRDSDLLTESNWECALEELGGEGESVMIYRFGHWACGWIEYLCVLENTPAYDIGSDIVKRIENYPVLDEGDWSERERIAADEVWKDCYSPRERIEYIRKSSGADFHSFRDLMQCVRGNYAPFTNDGYCGLIN